ncbi:polyamine ABC transporter substrate-binding protein [soil metagenome]
MNRCPAPSPFTLGLTRREVMRRARLTVVALGAAPSILAACGSDDDEGAGATTTPTTGGSSATTAGATGSSAAPAGGSATGAINYLSWEGYDLPVESVEAFETENGISVNPTYIANHDEIQAKLLAGGDSAGYDLITYYQGYKPLYAELEILTRLDESKIPNLAGLLPFWGSEEQNFWIDADGARTGVPFTWGSIGLTYNSDEISEMSSWYDLLDPSLTGRVGMVDDPVGNLALACKILSLDSGALPKDQMADVVELLEQFAAQTKGVAPSFGDMTTQLVSGDIVACFHGWAAMNSFAAAEGVTTIMTNLPEEGSHSFCDAYAIPPTAVNPDAAHAWINQSLDPTTNAEAAIYLVGAVTVADSVDQLDEATRALYPYEELEELLERAPLATVPPTESSDVVTFSEWSDAWQQIKAGV